MAIGFLVGLVVGWFQPMLAGTTVPNLSARLFMAAQTGAAFTVVALFALNYLEVRRRVYAKFMTEPAKKVSKEP